MKVYIENDNGARVEVKEIEAVNLNSDLIILMTDMRLMLRDKEIIEETMSEKMGKKCVVIDGMFTKVLGI